MYDVFPAHGPVRYFFCPFTNSYLYPLGSLNAFEPTVEEPVDAVEFVFDGDVGLVVDDEVVLFVDGAVVLVRYFIVPSVLMTYLLPLAPIWTGNGWAFGVLAIKYLFPVESVNTMPSG